MQMASVVFTVSRTFASTPADVWSALIDWDNHGEWIPATRMDLGDNDAHSVGDVFTAYTGYGPLTLVDRMRISELKWNEIDEVGECEVEKLGPVLSGTAGFIVRKAPVGAALDWTENVEVRFLPGPLGPPVSWIFAKGFVLAMRRLANTLS